MQAETRFGLKGGEEARTLRNYYVNTSQGHAVWTSQRPYPRVLLIHGFLRRADHMLHWGELIPGLGYLHLLGHSEKADFAETTIEAWIQGYREMLALFPEPPLILAESLGAVIAMALPSRALIAVEPPLSTHQLWPLQRNLEKARAHGMPVTAALEALFAQPFHWALEAIDAPTLVIAGDEPLLPERKTEFMPSMLTDEDFAAYAAHPKVEACRVPGGHDLMQRRPEVVIAAARPFMLQHGYIPA